MNEPCVDTSPTAPGLSATRANSPRSTHLPSIIIIKQTLVGECLTRCINDAFDQCTPILSFASGEAWLEAGLPNDIALYLLLMTGEGWEAQRNLVAYVRGHCHGQGPIVVITNDTSPRHVVDMLSMGVSGYLTTDLTLDVMIHALRLVLVGGRFVPSRSLIEAVQTCDRVSSDLTTLDATFTSRQVAVIEALRRGKPNKVIAYELNMCESTVKVHVRNIMKKLRAKNRTEVACKANEFLAPSTSAASRDR